MLPNGCGLSDVRPGRLRGSRWSITAIGQPLGHRIGLDKLRNGPIQVDGARLGERLLVPVAESGPQLPVQLAVLLRVGGPHPVTDQPGAALG